MLLPYGVVIYCVLVTLVDCVCELLVDCFGFACLLLFVSCVCLLVFIDVDL